MPKVETIDLVPEEYVALYRWIANKGLMSPLVPEEGALVTFYRTEVEDWETSLHRGSHVTRATWVRSTGQIIRIWFDGSRWNLADHLDPKTGFPRKAK